MVNFLVGVCMRGGGGLVTDGGMDAWMRGCVLIKVVQGHVSRTLNCTYLRPAPVGTKVFVESRVVHLGKRLAQTTGVMRLETADGKIAYTCEHGKAAVGGPNM